MSKKSQPDYLKHMADDCLGFRLRRLNRMVSTFYDEGLRPYKAKISQMNLLIIIGMNQQITPSQLGQYAQAEASTLSRNIDRMIQRGWIKAIPAEDGRSHLLALTSEGRDMLKKVYPAWKKAQQKVRKLLGEEMENALRQMDEKILKVAA